MGFPHVINLIHNHLPHAAVLQVMRSTRDSLGGDTKSWLTVQTVRGFMQELSRQKLMEFQGRLSEATHKFYFKDSVTISQEHRLIFLSKEYKVLAVSAATVNLYPHLSCALCQVLEGDIDIALP